MIIIMKTVPALDPVASYSTSMIGYNVGVLVTFSRSLNKVSSRRCNFANNVDNVPKTKKKYEDESKSNDTACNSSPDHGKRNLSRSILDFVGHVKN
jgi:hypothetical protein